MAPIFQMIKFAPKRQKRHERRAEENEVNSESIVRRLATRTAMQFNFDTESVTTYICSAARKRFRRTPNEPPEFTPNSFISLLFLPVPEAANNYKSPR